MHAVVSHEMRDGECGMAVTSDRKGDRSEKGQKQPIWGVCSPVWPPGLMPRLVVIGETAPQEGRSFWQHCVVLRLRRSLGGQRFGRMSKGWQTRELGGRPRSASIRSLWEGHLHPPPWPEQGIHPDGFTGDMSPTEEVLTCARNVHTHHKDCQLLLEITREAWRGCGIAQELSRQMGRYHQGVKTRQGSGMGCGLCVDIGWMGVGEKFMDGRNRTWVRSPVGLCNGCGKDGVLHRCWSSF